MEPDLPRPADDPENLRRLREEALRKLDLEERERVPAPVYGGPPVPAPRKFWRRWMLWVIGILVALVAWLMFKHHIWPVNPAPVYGGPPTPTPPAPALLIALRRITRKLG
jgi:hypothetical protein